MQEQLALDTVRSEDFDVWLRLFEESAVSIGGLVNEEGEVTGPETEEFLRNYMAEFALIGRVHTALPRSS